MKMKSLVIFCLLVLFLGFFGLGTSCFASIDIGEEVFVKSFSNSNFADSGDNALDTKSNTYERIRLSLKSNLQENIEAKVQFQAIGIWGASTDTVKINDYNYSNFTPFIEQAYIKANEFFKIGNMMKFNLIVGKQPMFYGDGYILSDNNRGVFAYKLEGIGSKFCDIDLWAIKAVEENVSYEEKQMDLNVYAGILKLDKFFYKENSVDKMYPYVYYVSEANKAIGNVDSTKNFAGVRIDGTSEDNFFYKIEVAQEFGDVKYSTYTQTYDGLFYDAAAKLKITNGIFKESFLKFDYLSATGADESNNVTSKNADFDPYFTTKSKESNDVYQGEIYSRLFPGLKNRQIIMTGLEYAKIKNLNIELNYYSFWKNSSSKFQGNEIDLILKKRMNDFINTRLIFAIFNKSQELPNLKDNINHISLEFDYRV